MWNYHWSHSLLKCFTGLPSSGTFTFMSLTFNSGILSLGKSITPFYLFCYCPLDTCALFHYFSILPSFPWMPTIVAASVSEVDESFRSLDTTPMSFGVLPSRWGGPHGQSNISSHLQFSSRPLACTLISWYLSWESRKSAASILSPCSDCRKEKSIKASPLDEVTPSANRMPTSEGS